MKVIAGLCWYDESPAHLARLVTSLTGVADHLVAIDGAYLHYPQGRASSDPLQYQVLIETAYAAGLGLTIHRQSTVWYGNEVEKRNFLMRQCIRAAEGPGDWILVMDGDEMVSAARAGWREQIEQTSCDAAMVRFWNRRPDDANELARSFWFPAEHGFQTHRVFFRALPNLRIKGNHYTYVAGDKTLRGADSYLCVPALDLSQVFEIEHRHDFRSTERNGLAARYYEIRDDLRLEGDHAIAAGAP